MVGSDKGLSGKADEVVKKYTHRLEEAKDERTVINYDTDCKLSSLII